MREALFALAYFRLCETKDWKVENKRIRYVIEGAWNDKLGESFDDVVRAGRKLCTEKGWITAPKSAGNTSAGKDQGESVAETFSKAVENPNLLAGMASQMLAQVATYLETIDYNTASEGVLEALRRIEEATIRKTYGLADGSVDIEAINDLYNDSKPLAKVA
jgi:hypothetical protein